MGPETTSCQTPQECKHPWRNAWPGNGNVRGACATERQQRHVDFCGNISNIVCLCSIVGIKVWFAGIVRIIHQRWVNTQNFIPRRCCEHAEWEVFVCLKGYTVNRFQALFASRRGLFWLDIHQIVASAPTRSWIINICSNKQKCHISVYYPASYLWSALEYSVYSTIIRILQSFAACFLLTKYSFQFQVWLTAYFYRTKLHLIVMEKALLVDVVFDMQHAKV